jgi:thioredoxin-dependent peroxiredoxin
VCVLDIDVYAIVDSSGGPMTHVFRLVSVALIAVGMLASPAFSQDLKVGDQAPDFTAPGTDGKTHTLSQLKGQWVVLAWFPKAFTGG